MFFKQGIGLLVYIQQTVKTTAVLIPTIPPMNKLLEFFFLCVIIKRGTVGTHQDHSAFLFSFNLHVSSSLRIKKNFPRRPPRSECGCLQVSLQVLSFPGKRQSNCWDDALLCYNLEKAAGSLRFQFWDLLIHLAELRSSVGLRVRKPVSFVLAGTKAGSDCC